MEKQSPPARPRPNNLRTGLLLAGVALFFFVMIFVKFIWLR
jgi:hypothetical protein